MNEKKENVPKLRFPGFMGDWEQRKLGELCNEFRSGEFIKASDIAPLGDYPVYGGNGLRGYASTYNHDGEFALIGRQGALCGNMQFSCGMAYFTEHAVAVSANYENETRFLYHLFGTMNLGQYSGQSAQPGLAVGNLIEIITLVPIKAEQTKIYELFDSLDHLITLHQRKLNNVKNLKVGLLQKMFPKDGEDSPEVRFPGFNEAWELRAFSDLAIRVSKSSDKDTLPRVEYEDIISGQGELNKDIAAKKSDKKGIEFEVGDTLFGKLRPYLQNWLLADFKGIAVGDWWVLRPNEMDSKFIYSLIQSNKYQTVANLSTGTKMPRSDWKVVSQTVFAVPTDINEQTKIGHFFKHLDNLISLHHRKLEHLQKLKKALQQQMFV